MIIFDILGRSGRIMSEMGHFHRPGGPPIPIFVPSSNLSESMALLSVNGDELETRRILLPLEQYQRNSPRRLNGFKYLSVTSITRFLVEFQTGWTWSSFGCTDPEWVQAKSGSVISQNQGEPGALFATYSAAT